MRHGNACRGMKHGIRPAADNTKRNNMKFITAISAAAALVLCTSVHAQDRNRDWGKFNRYAGANAALEASPKVVFMGDSITEYWYGMDPAFFDENGFAGRGISGQTAEQMLCRFQKDVIALHPKVVVINAGTNDVAGNNGKIAHEDVVDVIKSMCELARFHGITPVLTSVLPCNFFFWYQDIRPAQDIIHLNSLIKEYATRAGIIYVDYHSIMREEDGSLPKKYSDDGCHPTVQGYKVMEETILPYIDKALAL